MAAPGLMLLLNQYKSFLIATLIEDTWLIYCTRECSFHHTAVKLFTTVFFCNCTTGLIFQKASENVRRVSPLSYYYDFHVTTTQLKNLVIDEHSVSISSGRCENHHTPWSCELLCICFAPCCYRKEAESGCLQSCALCVLAKSFIDGPISFPNVWSWWCCWCSKDSLANGSFLLAKRTSLWKFNSEFAYSWRNVRQIPVSKKLQTFNLGQSSLIFLSEIQKGYLESKELQWNGK